MIDDNIFKILACPNCKCNLIEFTDKLFCQSCKTYFNIINGVPLFLENDSFSLHETFAADKSKFIKIFKKYLPNISLTTIVDKSIFNYISSLNNDEIVLNLGSGIGRFDYLIKHQKIINLDISLYPGVNIIADGHKLPIKSNSIGCVYSNAVLEHVARPWIVADEIYRVLKDNGIVCINVPFLNVIHEVYDFYRFTPQGLKILFHKFDEIKSGISSGPSSFITYFIPEFVSLFFPTSFIRNLIKDLFSILFYPLKYLDHFIKKRDRFKVIATSFYFI